MTGLSPFQVWILWGVSLTSDTLCIAHQSFTERERRHRRKSALPPSQCTRSPTPCSSSLRTVFLTTALGFAATLLGSKHFHCVGVTRVLHILFLNKVMWHSKDIHFSRHNRFIFYIIAFPLSKCKKQLQCEWRIQHE